MAHQWVGRAYFGRLSAHLHVMPLEPCVCAQLHTYLIDQRSPVLREVLPEDVAGESAEVMLQDRCDTDKMLWYRRKDGVRCPLRVAMTRVLEVKQIRTPASWKNGALLPVTVWLSCHPPSVVAFDEDRSCSYESEDRPGSGGGGVAGYLQAARRARGSKPAPFPTTSWYT